MKQLRPYLLKTAITLLIFALAGDLLSAEAERPAARRPNILLAIADDWSYGHAGAYVSAESVIFGSHSSRDFGTLITRR